MKKEVRKNIKTKIRKKKTIIKIKKKTADSSPPSQASQIFFQLKQN